MNTCGDGHCVCGGWTDDFGWHPCNDASRTDFSADGVDLIKRWYYWDFGRQVVLSVDQRTGSDGRQEGTSYFDTPERARLVGETLMTGLPLIDPETFKFSIAEHLAKQTPRKPQRNRKFSVKPKGKPT